MNDNKSSSSGIGLGGALLIVFITLKLCRVINWSWWWVLSPIWIVTGLVLIVLVIAATGYWLTRPKTPQEKAAAAMSRYGR